MCPTRIAASSATVTNNEIKTLKAKLRQHEPTIALLYGQLDARTP
jgi:hypothetical protein